MDSTYAPQSPDLSGFLSSPPKTQQPYHANLQPSSYAPRSPQLVSFDGSSAQSFDQNIHVRQSDTQSAFGWSGQGNDLEYNTSQYLPPIPPIPISHSFNHAPAHSPYRPPESQSHPQLLQGAQSIQSQQISSRKHAFDSTNISTDHSQPHKMSSRGPRIKGDPSSVNPNPNTPRKDPNPNNIEIKTKFPVARIKRIMQADEEVGKVAQVTPVAVNKALELFMIALVTGAAEKAKERGGKKVTAQHLKSVVLGSPEQFDFLGEIVERVSEAQEGAGGEGRKRKEKAKEESDSSAEEKKVKKTRGRKKKTEA